MNATARSQFGGRGLKFQDHLLPACSLLSRVKLLLFWCVVLWHLSMWWHGIGIRSNALLLYCWLFLELEATSIKCGKFHQPQRLPVTFFRVLVLFKATFINKKFPQPCFKQDSSSASEASPILLVSCNNHYPVTYRDGSSIFSQG